MNFKFEISEQDLENSKVVPMAVNIAEALLRSLKCEEPSSTEIVDEQQETEAENVAETTEEKPKRKRRTKAEIEAARAEEDAKKEDVAEAQVVEPIAEAKPVEEVQPEAPLEEAKEENTMQTLIDNILKSGVCTVEEFRKVYKWKMESLNMCPGQADENKAKFFTDFVHKLSEGYGNRLPSKLTPEARCGFIEQFVTIVRNGDTCELSKAPF